MRKATFIPKNGAAFIHSSNNLDNTVSLHKMQERYIRRRMNISHNQAKLIASLFWGGEID